MRSIWCGSWKRKVHVELLEWSNLHYQLGMIRHGREPMGMLGYNYEGLETLMYCWKRLAPWHWWLKHLGQVRWAHGNTPSYVRYVGNVFPRASLGGCGDKSCGPMLLGLQVVVHMSQLPKVSTLGASMVLNPSWPPNCTQEPNHTPYFSIYILLHIMQMHAQVGTEYGNI